MFKCISAYLLLALPKNDASIEIALFSMTCQQRFAFAHTVVHRMCSQPWKCKDGGIVEILLHKHKICAALFLCTRILSFEIKVLALSQMYCAQSYPQNMCRTGLAANVPTRYIAAFVVPRGFSLAGSFSGVCFARHSSSCRLADLVFADRLDHRARAHH
jgi:hypothetical protein